MEVIRCCIIFLVRRMFWVIILGKVVVVVRFAIRALRGVIKVMFDVMVRVRVFSMMDVKYVFLFFYPN